MPSFPMRSHLETLRAKCEEWLAAYTSASLQMLCRARGIPVRKGAGRRTLCRTLAAELFRSGTVRVALEGLTAEEREWLEHCRRRGGVLGAKEIAHLRAHPERDVALRRLVARGLLLPGPFDGRVPQETLEVTDPRGPLWCPEPVLLMAEERSPAALLRPYRGERAGEKRADFRLLEYDLMVMARQLSQAPVRRLKSGFPGKRFLSRVADQLRVPVDLSGVKRMETGGRLLFLYELLEVMGLLAVRHERITTAPAIGEFFRSPPQERLRRLFHAWQELTRYNELYYVPEIALERPFPDYAHGDGKTDDLPTPERLVEARQFLISLAAQMPPGEWIALDDVIWTAYMLDDAFLIGKPQSHFYAHAPLYRGIWPADEAHSAGAWGGALERAGNWHLVEGGFIRQVFTESLHALGLVDVGRMPDGHKCVRLNEIGAWLIAGGPEPELPLPQGRALVVQPNFDVIVFPEGQDVSVLWPLMQAAEIISRDVTLTFRLTADSIYRAAQQGIPAERVLALLRRYARSPVPENVAQAMSDWDHRYQQVVITTFVDLVEADSPEHFTRFLAQINAEQTLVRPLSDTVGVVVGPVSKLPPMTVLDYQASLPPSVKVDPDLRITIVPARENWLIRPKLALFAEQVGPHEFHITHASARRAISGGYFYDEVSDLLQQAAIGGVPVRAAFKLQGLFGRLGTVALGEVVLLQVTREHILTKMLQIDEFREVLLQRLGPVTAIVRADGVRRMRALLETFGIKEDASLLNEPRLPPKREDAPEEMPAHEEVRHARLPSYSVRKMREMLEEAIRQNRRVRLYYRPHAGGRVQERTVDPIDVERRYGVPYLTAYCHLRGEVQVFRIPSIVGLELLDTPASPR